MNTNTMELNMNEMELVNGGIEWGKIFKEAAWGVGIGAACGAGVGAEAGKGRTRFLPYGGGKDAHERRILGVLLR
jgi:hypothetical protein